MSRTNLLILLGLLAVTAKATTITIESAGVGTAAIANAVAERNAWLLANFGASAVPDLLTGFENDSLGAYSSLDTSAGVFSVMPGSKPGDGGTQTDQFSILDSGDSPFKGRFNTTPGGSQWLDSNDITQVQLATDHNVIYFFINDVNDNGGTLTIKTKDGTTSAAFAPSGQNGDLYFVAIKSSGPIGDIQWLNSSNNDGFGLDDFGTVAYAPAPEPVALPLAAAGLLAIPLIRKYKSRASRRPENL